MPKVSVFVERSKETKELEVDNISDIFSKLNVNPDTVIIALNDSLVTSKAKIKDGDKIKLLSVISGG